MTPDWDIDISDCQLQELRLLRSYPYAIHGYHFMEADINAFFTANAPWFQALEEETYYAWEDSLYNNRIEWRAPTYDDVRLTDAEAAFVKRVDSRIEELQRQRYDNRGDYRLLNPSTAVNLFQFRDVDTTMMRHLAADNFALIPNGNIQLFHIYEENDYRQIPNFVTTDLFLQAFHMFFAYTLKSVEKESLRVAMTDMCRELYDASQAQRSHGATKDIRAMGEYGMTYFSIPYYYLSGNDLPKPRAFEISHRQELLHIDKGEDAISDFLNTEVNFPYSLFRPRGYYSQADWSIGYFRAMMWLQQAYFCRENGEQLQRAIFFASLLNNSEKAMQAYRSVNEIITYLMGTPDNLSVLEIADYLKSHGITDTATALSPDNVELVDNYLADLAKKKNRIKPKIELSCSDKINFMPQRYMIDNEILLTLTDETANSDRAYPKGADVFAVLGCKNAADVLDNYYDEPSKWGDYSDERQKLKKQFDSFNSWNSTVYNKWIESLVSLQNTGKNYPGFMHTDAWGLKNLNTALASWTELKHDAILYGEQPMVAECGGGGMPAPVVVGYVEPNLDFWNKLKELTSLTEDILKRNNMLSADISNKIAQMNDYIDFCITVSEKEIKGERLSEQEFRTIQFIGASVEYFTLSLIDPDKYFQRWDDINGPDKSLAIVADVLTRNVLGCDRNGILYEATGNANAIYVIVEIGGESYLTRGATYSYYEFVRPLDKPRMTDEEWQKEIGQKGHPKAPGWLDAVTVTREPRVDERTFYSSGC